MLRSQISVFPIALLLTAAAAVALPPNAQLEVQTIAEMREVTNEVTGEAIFVPAERLRVGDEVFYTVAVRNPTESELRDVIIVRPVPANTRYVHDSAVGPGCRVTLSTDGGATFQPEREFDGSLAITHIRWQLRHPLAPGAVAMLRFRSVFK